MVSYGSIGQRRASSGFSSSVQDSSSTSSATPSPPSPLATSTKTAFYVFGFVSNIPWNALILSLPYLLDRLQGSPLQTYLGSSLVITFNVAGLVALAIATWLADKLRPAPSIVLSVCVISLTFLILATIPLWPNSALFITAILSALLLASAKSFFKTPVVAVATTFGPDALASYLSGSSLVAVVISAGVFLAVYLSNSHGAADGQLGTIISCSLCALISLSSLFAFRFAIQNTEIYRSKFNPRANPDRDWLLRMHLRMVLVQGDGVWATTKRNWGYNLAQCWLYIVTVVRYVSAFL
ncbi:Nucleoside transporter [Ceratobasidium sp. AG-Ba]|nr:Nucleoside transporter [Ceratobasidium sp. AG-Ba]QRW14161.1 Nucleoside transporter [Ceratobasidium sp. AG-Ba]